MLNSCNTVWSYNKQAAKATSFLHCMLCCCYFFADDPKLREFLGLMQPRVNKAVWSNDDTALEMGTTALSVDGSLSHQASALQHTVLADEEEEDSDGDELYEDLDLKSSSSRDRGTPAGDEGSDNDDDDDHLDQHKARGKKDHVVVAPEISDMEYLRSRVRKHFDDDDNDRHGADGTGDSEDDAVHDSSNDDGRSSSSSSSDDDDTDEKMGVNDAPLSLDERTRRRMDQGNKHDDAERDDIDAIFDNATHEDGNDAHVDEDDERKMGQRGMASDEHQDLEHPSTLGPLPSSLNEGEDQDPRVLIRETSRLFVRNLPYTAGEEELKACFEPFGEILEAHIVLDKVTKRSKGFALLRFADPTSAVAAFTDMDGQIFMGRLLHILPGKPPPSGEFCLHNGLDDSYESNIGEDNIEKTPGTSSFKRQRDADLKASAGTNRSAWNALFMRSDTVAEAVATHYGVQKADLLDPHAPDMAVRLALGEAQVIAETKSYLEESGVDIQSLEAAAEASTGRGSGRTGEKGVQRSDTVILVKNLPYQVDETELMELFGRYGLVARVVLPPTHTLAFVEFVEPHEARKAFSSLAYKKFHSVPMYLEWAPKRIFSRPPSSTKTALASIAAQKAKNVESMGAAAGQQHANAAAVAEEKDVRKTLTAGAALDVSAELTTKDVDLAIESSTIYVKNLAFSTVEKNLHERFKPVIESCGGNIRSVRIAWRTTKDGRRLSSGFGFVECSSEDVARDTIAKLQNTVLDGHRLVLQLSRGGNSVPDRPSTTSGPDRLSAKQPDGNEGTKIVVRNVAFEATRKDILGLFSPFGEISSCRLPKKFDGTHRGFAFVEFSTRQEARSAVQAVVGTHLYGRRLVIEWAQSDGGLEELREKTALTFRGDAGALEKGKMSRKRVEEDSDGHRGDAASARDRSRSEKASKRRKKTKDVK